MRITKIGTTSALERPTYRAGGTGASERAAFTYQRIYNQALAARKGPESLVVLSFDGPAGTGKTTLVKEFADYLNTGQLGIEIQPFVRIMQMDWFLRKKRIAHLKTHTLGQARKPNLMNPDFWYNMQKASTTLAFLRNNAFDKKLGVWDPKKQETNMFFWPDPDCLNILVLDGCYAGHELLAEDTDISYYCVIGERSRERNFSDRAWERTRKVVKEEVVRFYSLISGCYFAYMRDTFEDLFFQNLIHLDSSNEPQLIAKTPEWQEVVKLLTKDKNPEKAYREALQWFNLPEGEEPLLRHT